MKLSVFSIVKNEEAMIEDMLKSAVDADEHVIIDTGSTDKTIDICKKYTDNIHTDYVWNDNFAEAKNYALSKCTGDWIIGLDADCRFEEGAITKIKEAIETTDKDVLSVRLVWNDIQNRDSKYHWLPKLFRRTAGVQYVGRVHEHPSKLSEGKVDAAIVFLYSPNHYTDPDRNIRILLKDDMTKPRNMFYLGREYFDRRKWDDAIRWLNKYLEHKTWIPERAEAYITLAKCYWYSNRGDEARNACLQAININPDFKEALLLMSDMHYEPNKSKWKKLSDVATNDDVLFVRF